MPSRWASASSPSLETTRTPCTTSTAASPVRRQRTTPFASTASRPATGVMMFSLWGTTGEGGREERRRREGYWEKGNEVGKGGGHSFLHSQNLCKWLLFSSFLTFPPPSLPPPLLPPLSRSPGFSVTVVQVLWAATAPSLATKRSPLQRSAGYPTTRGTPPNPMWLFSSRTPPWPRTGFQVTVDLSYRTWFQDKTGLLSRLAYFSWSFYPCQPPCCF